MYKPKLTNLVKVRWNTFLSRLRHAADFRISLLGDWLLRHNSPLLLRRTCDAREQYWKNTASYLRQENEAERAQLNELIRRIHLLTIELRSPASVEANFLIVVELDSHIARSLFEHGDHHKVRLVVRHLMTDIERGFLSLNPDLVESKSRIMRIY